MPRAQDDPVSSSDNRSRDAATDSTNSYARASREPLASDRTSQKPGITFAAQDKLPKLPIPDLESSCRQYVESLKALQTPREHEDSAAAVQDFLKHEGPILQERLKKYSTGKTSYIEQFCTQPQFNPDLDRC